MWVFPFFWGALCDKTDWCGRKYISWNQLNHSELTSNRISTPIFQADVTSFMNTFEMASAKWIKGSVYKKPFRLFTLFIWKPTAVIDHKMTHGMLVLTDGEIHDGRFICRSKLWGSPRASKEHFFNKGVKWQREERKSSLTHAAPRVITQLPPRSTATLDLAIRPHGTCMVTTAISKLTGCDICSRKEEFILRLKMYRLWHCSVFLKKLDSRTDEACPVSVHLYWFKVIFCLILSYLTADSTLFGFGRLIWRNETFTV